MEYARFPQPGEETVTEINTVLSTEGMDRISTFELSDQYVTTATTTSISQSGFGLSIDRADGTKIEINMEDMYNDLEKIKKKNEELEARLFKMEEQIRFLREI